MLRILSNPIRRREALWGYAMIAPLMIGYLIFFWSAMGASAVISMTKWDVLSPPEWVGLQNYVELATENEIFGQTLSNTTRLTIMSVVIGQLISLALALALNAKIRFRNIYRLIFFLPLLTMPVSISIVWKWLYNPTFGLLNLVLKAGGFQGIDWLNDPNWALFSLVIMGVWMGVGYSMIIYLAGLQNIPGEYYEAAQIDGANSWQQLMRITIPLLTPTIFFNLVTSIIGSFQVFDIVFTMTRGRPLDTTRTVVYTIYEEGFHFFNMGTATSMAWILFFIILMVTVFQLWGQKRWVHYE